MAAFGIAFDEPEAQLWSRVSPVCVKCGGTGYDHYRLGVCERCWRAETIKLPIATEVIAFEPFLAAYEDGLLLEWDGEMFQPGDRVNHPVYGGGVVAECEEGGICLVRLAEDDWRFVLTDYLTLVHRGGREASRGLKTTTGEKVCSRCKAQKSMNDFSPSKCSVDGRVSRCRKCVREIYAVDALKRCRKCGKSKKRSEFPKAGNWKSAQLSVYCQECLDSAGDNAICSRCREAKPLTEFHRNRSKFQGRDSKCKPCRRIADLEFYHRKKIQGKAQG